MDKDAFDQQFESTLEDWKGSAWQALAFEKANRDTTNDPTIPWTLSSDAQISCLRSQRSRSTAYKDCLLFSKDKLTHYTNKAYTSLDRRQPYHTGATADCAFARSLTEAARQYVTLGIPSYAVLTQ